MLIFFVSVMVLVCLGLLQALVLGPLHWVQALHGPPWLTWAAIALVVAWLIGD